MLLVACDKVGGVSTPLPEQGSYTSNQPISGTVPCVDGKAKQTVNVGFAAAIGASSDCIDVKDPYGEIPPKDLTPKITFPDFNTSTPEILVLPGNAYATLVSSANITTISVACDPSATVTLTPNTGMVDSYLLYLGAMSSNDTTCTITGNGVKGDASAKLTFKPAPSNYVEKLEVRNLLTQIPIKVAGDSFPLNNFYVRGYDKTTTVTVECSSGQKPALVDVVGKLGWYSMVVFGPSDLGATESCTVSASRSSDGQTAASTVKLSTPDIKYAPSIAAENFKDGDAMFMIPPNFKNSIYVASIGDYKDQPFPRITVHNIDSPPVLKINCTDNNGAGFVPTCDAYPICLKDPDYLQCQSTCGKQGDPGYQGCDNTCYSNFYNLCAQKTCPITDYPSTVQSLGKMLSPPNPADTYEFDVFINYKGIGTANSMDTCTITAVSEKGGKAIYKLAVKHVVPILTKPGLIFNTGATVFSDSFVVSPFDNATKVTVECTLDKSPKLVTQIAGQYYFSTLASSKIGDSNICTVMVAHGNGAPVAYRTMTVTATQ